MTLRVNAYFCRQPPHPDHPWIGDFRRATIQPFTHPLSPRQARHHLLVATKSIITGHMDEASRLLDLRYFITESMASRTPNITGRKGFWDSVHAKLDTHSTPDFEPPEVIGFTTYSANTADATAHGTPTMTSLASERNFSFLHPGRVWDTVFLDEAGDIRNTEAGKSKAVRRLVERCCVVVAATATPIYSSILDIPNICRTLGLPFFVQRTGTTPSHFMNIETDNSGIQFRPPLGQHGRYEYDLCPPQIRYVCQAARSSYMKLMVKRKALIKHREAKAGQSDADGAQPASPGPSQAAQDPDPALKSLGVQLPPSWQETPLPSDSEDPLEKSICEDIKRYRLEVESAVPIVRSLMDFVMIRRVHESKGFDGLPLTDIQHVVPEIVAVKMGPEQHADYEQRMAITSERDKQFWVNLRRYLKHPNATNVGYTDSHDIPSAALAELTRRLSEWQTQQALQSDDARKEKLVVHIIWTGLLPFFQAHLHANGIFTASLTGSHSAARRRAICVDFAKDSDHPADRVVSLHSSLCARRTPAQRSRILFITDVGQTGINLQRANVIHLFDPSWAHADIVQIIGRVNRIGQKRPVQAFLYYHEDSFEMDLYRLVKSKEEASTGFFLGDQDASEAALEEIRKGVEGLNKEGGDDSVTKKKSDDLADARARARQAKVDRLAKLAVNGAFDPDNVLVLHPPSQPVKGRPRLTRAPIPPLAEDRWQVVRQRICDLACVDDSDADWASHVFAEEWPDIDTLLMRHRCRLLIKRLAFTSEDTFSPQQRLSMAAERKLLWSWHTSE